jgi:hypothetical protein
MIKYFRKIRLLLLSENRFSKYLLYAIGEIVLVVFGILIALQVNNWNEQRNEAAEEQKILKTLQTEFLYNRQELKRNIDKAKALSQTADSILHLFTVKKPARDNTNSLRLIRSLSAYSSYDPSEGALIDLISSGRLNLIKNDSLRLHLTRWSGELQDTKEDEVRLMNFGDVQLEPYRLKYLTLPSHSIFGSRIDTLFSSGEFENIVYILGKRSLYNVENYEMLAVEIENILAIIDEELK